MTTKTTRTFSINDDLYERFMKIVNDNNINKSKLVESFIEKYVMDEEKKSL